jgi:hypothetical protein
LTIIKAIWHDHLFDSCQLRHRQDIELERDRHGPFDKMGLICLGIPATALMVCIVATDVEPQVTGEGKDAPHGLSVEFGRVLGGM